MNLRDLVAGGVAVAAVTGVVVAGMLGPGHDPGAASTPVPVREPAGGPSDPSAASTPGDAASPGLVVPAAELDPRTMPRRPVEQAAVLAELFDEDGTFRGLAAVDAATGEWVLSDLVSETPGGPLLLSPDGRSLVRDVWDDDGLSRHVEVVELGTGAARPVDLTLDPDCSLDAVAWAPDGRHLGVVSGCFTPTTDPDEPQLASVVLEVDLTSGATRVLERVPDAYPCETYPGYSPDGRFFAYGIGHATESDDDEDEWCSVRVSPVHDGTVREWEHVHMTYGDAWRNATTLLVWDEFAAPGGPDSHLVLDAPTGSATSYRMDRLTNTHGFLSGALLVEQTNWVEEPIPCRVALCSVDLGAHTVTPWLTVAGGGRIGFVDVARAVVGG